MTVLDSIGTVKLNIQLKGQNFPCI